MATIHKNLSDVNTTGLRDVDQYNFAIVVSEWNAEVTESLYSGAIQTFSNLGVKKGKIKRINVPGTFELSLGAQWMAQLDEIDAVICLGCVIEGETRHFEFICQAVAKGCTDVSLKFNKPIIFGVLTTENQKQALDRAGGRHGNKGDEAAATAIKMLMVRK